MEWEKNPDWRATAACRPAPSGTNPASAVFSFSTPAASSSAAAAAAPTNAAAAAPAPAPAPAAAPAATPAPAPAAPAPAAAGGDAGGRHVCPHCHKMGTHRPEECRSAPANLVLPPGTLVLQIPACTTVAQLHAIMPGLGPQTGPRNGVKKSRRRRGKKTGKKTDAGGPKTGDNDPGADGAGDRMALS